MRVLVFTKEEQSYFEEKALDEFESNIVSSNTEIKRIDIYDVEGCMQAKVYDVLCTPSVILTTDDGTYIYGWPGTIPSSIEVKHYLTM